MTTYNELKTALEAMVKEYRALDLPYGSAAYQQAVSVLNNVKPTSNVNYQGDFAFGYVEYGLRKK